MGSVRQALVAIGGYARRLRGDGVEVPISKSFLRCGAFALLDLGLQALREAGIEEVVLAHHTDEQRERAEELIDPERHPAGVRWFRDAGVGVHGIPFQALGMLDEVFLFDAGHSVSEPVHHERLIAAWRSGTAVFSAFRPALGNPRFAVLEDHPHRGPRTWALAQPMVVDRTWALTVATHGFSIDAAAADYRDRGLLRWVAGELPVEFDRYGEYRRARNKLEANMSGCVEGTPWMDRPRGDPPTETFARAALMA